jgi:NADPH-dependent 2,4-dienoyl-CoA reductase/sulfur reductase-like enzyme
MTRFELVIAGGGLAGARAIKSYREAGGGGQIALLSKESDLPYHRPALSKRYLRAKRPMPPSPRMRRSTATTTLKCCSRRRSLRSTRARAE